MDNRIELSLDNIYPSALTHTVLINNVPIHTSVLFNKKTVTTKFSIGKLHNNDIKIETFRTLDKSPFCKQFLKLANMKNNKYSFENKFSGINSYYEEDLFMAMRECHDLRTGKATDRITNYLVLLGFRFCEFNDDYLFMLIQRRCFSKNTQMNVIRSSGIQFATPTGLDMLNRYNKKFEENTMKRKKSKVPSFLLGDESINSSCSSDENINNIELIAAFDEEMPNE